MGRTLTIFPSGDAAGTQLAREIAARGERLGYQPVIESGYAGLASLRACLCDTAAVYDLSDITEGSRRVPSKAYRALTPLHMGLQHVLVVSRGYLPLNVVPVRRGGAPAYPYPATSLPDGRTVEPVADQGSGEIRRRWTGERDQSLLAWVEEQLADVADGAGVPQARCTPDQWAEMTAAMQASDSPDVGAMVRIEKDLMDASHDWNEGRQPKGQVFISHRGRYWAEVETLAGEVRAGRVPGVAALPVRVVRPGELAAEREMLSEGRRWMVLGLLDDMLRASAELWVYETGDYLGSWWTLAELVAASYIDDGEHAPPAIKAVTPSSRVGPAQPRYRIALAEEDRRQIARYMTNSRPDAVSPELAFQHRLQRGIFRVGLGGPFLRLLRKAAASPDMSALTHSMSEALDPDLEGELSRHFSDPDEFRARINHPSYRPEFWNDLLLDRAVLDGSAGYPPSAAAFLAAPGTMIRVSGRAAAAAVRDSGRVTARDGTRLRITEFAPRYLWRPTRIGGLIGGGLRRLPTYVAEP